MEKKIPYVTNDFVKLLPSRNNKGIKIVAEPTSPKNKKEDSLIE
ncbi:hypothetical protein [Metabacillus iocasae]|nr:hypothetical protein [Metabacillus iocasae]